MFVPPLETAQQNLSVKLRTAVWAWPKDAAEEHGGNESNHKLEDTKLHEPISLKGLP